MSRDVTAPFICQMEPLHERSEMKRIIDLEQITHVLLSDRRGYPVLPGRFHADGDIAAEGGAGNANHPVSCVRGATWVKTDTLKGIAGPISSIVAWNYSKREHDVAAV